MGISKGSQGEVLEGHIIAPETKRALLQRLYEAWLVAPELRFGELIENALGFRDPEGDPLSLIEDEALADDVRNYVDMVHLKFG